LFILPILFTAFAVRPAVWAQTPKKPKAKPSSASGAKHSHSTAAKPAVAPAVTPEQTGGLTTYAESLPNSVVKLNMIAIPGGAVTLAGKQVAVKPFWIASTETPWEAYDVFTSSGPPSVAYDQTKFAADAIARPSKSYILPDLGWGHHGRPVINVSFLSVTMFCRWLSSVTNKKYRVPTEAEWEYACKAGSAAPVKLTKAQAMAVAWYADNSDGITQPVGKKAPNAWKLYDMFGNVGEWATDADGKPVLCGPHMKDKLADLKPSIRRRWEPAWQATDPQLPKSRWWLSDGFFCGFRVVCEP
jgi:formylglycine-generating enzyme required for sulfatase activity